MTGKTTADSEAAANASPNKNATQTTAETHDAASTAKAPVAEGDIPALLRQLKLAQPGAEDSSTPQKDHKFWKTQPVPQAQDSASSQSITEGALPEDGAIYSDEKCLASVKGPEQLLPGFEWCELDLNADKDIRELYDLLYAHYVEDTDGSFRFNYSAKFLSWALKPPGWKKEWHIGVRTKPASEGKEGKLVAFISGVPALLSIRGSTVKTVEVNFLTVHHKLRDKRLAPVMIKEITRRCYKVGIFQALYTAGTQLPTPVSTCRYFHRSLDWSHLYKCGFSHIPHGSTELRQKLRYKLESQTSLTGFRPMKAADIPAVRDLLTRYTNRFMLNQTFSEEELAHFLCSEASKDVVWSYVVEQKGKITDVVSYYALETTVLRSVKNEKIRAAYLYYYASETAFASKKQSTEQTDVDALRLRLRALVHEALITAKSNNFHVFNALTLQDNPLFLKDQKFEPGDGKLHYYLFNWRTSPLPGGIDQQLQIDETKTGGVGVVML